MRSLLLLLPLLAAPASAAVKSDDGKWVPAVYFDVLSPGSQIKRLRDARAAYCGGGANAAATGCSGTFSTYASLGGRVALQYETEDYRWAASFGVLTGGPERGRVSVNQQAPSGALTTETRGATFRALGEATQKWLITDALYGGVGAGLGMAVSNQTVSCSGAGPLGARCGVGGTTNFGWFAWELTPSLMYQELEFALKYAGFARGGRAPWNAWGLSLGFRFL